VIGITVCSPFAADDLRGLGDIAEEGAMEKARQQRISTAGLENGRRVGMVVSGAALFAQITVVFTPTAASAFDIRGLIGTAIALQMGAYYGAPYHQARGHVAWRHDSDSNGNNSGAERDARDVSDHAGKSDTKFGAHQSPASAEVSPLASERDAAANEAALFGRPYGDESVYRSSR
jgi:hypothetical protein